MGTNTKDLWAALLDLESEIPASELSAYLREVERIGVPIRWNTDLDEFEEIDGE